MDNRPSPVGGIGHPDGMDIYWQLFVSPFNLGGSEERPAVPVGGGTVTRPMSAAFEAADLLDEASAMWGHALYRLQIGEVEILATPGVTTDGQLDPITLTDIIDAAPTLFARSPQP